MLISFAVPHSSSGSFRNGLGHQFSPMLGDQAKIIGYGLDGVSYDMICHDMILDAAKVYEIMPADTKFIGLVRDPVYHFKALWDAHRHRVRGTPAIKILLDSVVARKWIGALCTKSDWHKAK